MKKIILSTATTLLLLAGIQLHGAAVSKRPVSKIPVATTLSRSPAQASTPAWQSASQNSASQAPVKRQIPNLTQW